MRLEQIWEWRVNFTGRGFVAADLVLLVHCWPSGTVFEDGLSRHSMYCIIRRPPNANCFCVVRSDVDVCQPVTPKQQFKTAASGAVTSPRSGADPVRRGGF